MSEVIDYAGIHRRLWISQIAFIGRMVAELAGLPESILTSGGLIEDHPDAITKEQLRALLPDELQRMAEAARTGVQVGNE